jgi:multiple sugar transport system substrate-binding protein
MFFSITRNAALPEVAARFIDFTLNSLDANRILLAERGAPIAGRVRADLRHLVSAPQKAVFDFLDRIQDDVAPLPPPDPVGNTDLINRVFVPQVVDPVMYGLVPAPVAMKLLRRQSSDFLNK